MSDHPLFSPSLISPSVAAELPENYTIRPLRRSDYHHGFLDVLRVLTTVNDISEAKWNERYDWMSERNDEYYLLCILDGSGAASGEGRIVGTGAVLVERKFIHDLSLVGHIEDIAVAKDQQGKKLGLRIIQALDYVAEKVGCYKTILDCSEANEGFYVKCGFKRAGLEMAHYYDSPKNRQCDPQEPPSDTMSFDPVDLTQPNTINKRILPDEIWTPILEHGCAFPPHIFTEVMLNLIQNPNINSTHLFRADILYDSHGKLAPPSQEGIQTTSKSTTPEHGTLDVALPNFDLQRTIVGKLIPRNAQLDKPLLQTYHILHSTASDSHGSGSGNETTLVLYLPHASSPTQIPHYHPTVHGLAFQHTWRPPAPSPSPAPPHPTPGLLTLHYALFPSTPTPTPLPPRLHRTAQHLLRTLHKHGTGTLRGYTKRVHHDLLIPQPRLQNTYAGLKARHARRLLAAWAEQTPAAKHVFEDLAIAAFLLELWADLYGPRARDAKSGFPGFVDVGCGNGVLVDVLSREGYEGWGFDARRRKTWGTFGEGERGRVRRRVLVPRVVRELERERERVRGSGVECVGGGEGEGESGSDEDATEGRLRFHNGVFPPGTFVVSNHADELTPWTPLLASLSRSPFLAIPCCSHDLSGARSRAHVPVPKTDAPALGPGSEKGDLRTLRARAKQPSAYASLVAWVERLATDVGFVVEREVLRIPSTRNLGVVGRFVGLGEGGEEGYEAREERVREIVRREGGAVGWVERAVALAGPVGRGRGH